MDIYTRTAFRFAAIVAIGGFIFGLDAALISGTVRFIVEEFGLNDLQLGTVVSAPGFGVLFALVVAGPICEKIGRKKTLLIISTLYFISALWSGLAASYQSLVLARFLGGLAFASLSLASMYIGEIAPASIRGKLVSMNQILIVIGLSGAYFSNYALVQSLAPGASTLSILGNDIAIWRVMLEVETLPALIWLLLIFTIPESPRWLISVNRVEEARSVLSRLLPSSEVEPQIAAIEASLQHGKHTHQSIWKRLSDLCDKNVRRAMLIGFIFACVQPITGVNAILFYAPMVFEQTGIGTGAAYLQSLILGVVSLVFTIGALVLIDRVGRRPLVVGGLIASVGCLMLCWWAFSQATYELDAAAIAELGSAIPDISVGALSSLQNLTIDSDIAYKQELVTVLGEELAKKHESALIQAAVDINVTAVLVGIIGFIAAFHISIGPIMWVVFSEVVPVHIRGLAIPMFAFTTSLISYFVQKLFPWQLNNLGAAEIFLFYGVAGFVGLLMLYFVLPETKNKTIEEIEDLLSANSAHTKAQRT